MKSQAPACHLRQHLTLMVVIYDGSYNIALNISYNLDLVFRFFCGETTLRVCQVVAPISGNVQPFTVSSLSYHQPGRRVEGKSNSWFQTLVH